MQVSNVIASPEIAEELQPDDPVREGAREAEKLHEREAVAIEETEEETSPKGRLRKLIEASKEKKTPKLLLQIWHSDYSIIAFVVTMASFYIMKTSGYPPIGVLFFTLAMSTVDAILSIFVVRLSFHQNKHGFYRTEDYERDWLRYRMLLSMTKTALLFVVGISCGTLAIVASYIIWFFTSTQRLRYIILRWSMDDHYPDLQRWSVFVLLQWFGVEPKLKNFNLMAVIGIVLGFAIAFYALYT